MKYIGIIFLFLIFSMLSVFGQTASSNLQVSDLPHLDVGQGKLVSGFLIAQGGTRQGSETATDTQLETAPTDSKPDAVADQDNAGTKREQRTKWEKKQRVLKIVNDYELTADEVLTTLIMIAGDARLQGSVTGNVLVLGGDVELTPGAQVNGTLQIIGGQVSGSMEGVANLEVSNDWEIVPAGMKLVMHPYIFWKITGKQANLRLTIVESGISLLMYLLMFAVFPKPINTIGGLLARRPIGSVLFGVLMLPVIPLTLTLLTLSIVGVPFMLLGLALLFGLAICGKTAIFVTLGGTLFSGRLKPLGVIFAYALYFMATALPYIDWVTFLLVNAISIGLCVLSGISMMLPQDPRKNISWSERV